MSKVGEGILRGARQAAAYAKDKDSVPGVRVHRIYVPDKVEVKAIRKQLNLTQVQFSETFGFKVGSIRDWEQNRRTPDTAARAFLKVIEKDPEAVTRALAQ